MNGRFLNLRNRQDALENIYRMRRLFDCVWPTVLGNKTQFQALMFSIQDSLDKLTHEARELVNQECETLEALIDPEADTRVFVSYRKAIAMLPEADVITVTRSVVANVIIAEEWSRRKVQYHLADYPPQLSGELATAAGFGLAAVDNIGPVFIETRKKEAPG